MSTKGIWEATSVQSVILTHVQEVISAIFIRTNPDVVKELGDVGNDIGIYGNRLYVVVNCSNFVEVMNVHTAEHIGSVTIPNCRYIVFNGDKAYVSSYAGPVQIDPNARREK